MEFLQSLEQTTTNTELKKQYKKVLFKTMGFNDSQSLANCPEHFDNCDHTRRNLEKCPVRAYWKSSSKKVIVRLMAIVIKNNWLLSKNKLSLIEFIKQYVCIASARHFYERYPNKKLRLLKSLSDFNLFKHGAGKTAVDQVKKFDSKTWNSFCEIESTKAIRGSIFMIHRNDYKDISDKDIKIAEDKLNMLPEVQSIVAENDLETEGSSLGSEDQQSNYLPSDLQFDLFDRKNDKAMAEILSSRI